MARVQANTATAKLDTYWSQIRLAKFEVIGMSLVRVNSRNNAVVDLPSPHSDCPSLLDALEVHIDQKGKGRLKTYRLAAERSCNYVMGICICGNTPLSG